VAPEGDRLREPFLPLCSDSGILHGSLCLAEERRYLLQGLLGKKPWGWQRYVGRTKDSKMGEGRQECAQLRQHAAPLLTWLRRARKDVCSCRCFAAGAASLLDATCTAAGLSVAFNTSESAIATTLDGSGSRQCTAVPTCSLCAASSERSQDGSPAIFGPRPARSTSGRRFLSTAATKLTALPTAVRDAPTEC